MGRGDNFKGVAGSRSLQPGEPSWTDRVEYLLRILTGDEVSKAEAATVQVDSDAFTSLGKPTDVPANAAALEADPARAYNQIQLLKAIFLLSNAIAVSTYDLEVQVAIVNNNLATVNTNLNDIESGLSDIEVELSGFSTAFDSYATLAHNDLVDIETLAQSIRDRLDDPLDVTATVDTSDLATEATLTEVRDLLKPLVATNLESLPNLGTVQTIVAADPTRRGLFGFNNSVDSTIYLTYDGSEPSPTNAMDRLDPGERRMLSSPTSAVKFMADSPTVVGGFFNLTEHF